MRTVRTDEELVQKYGKLVWQVVHKYSRRLPPVESVEDLHSHLTMALLRCVRYYDSEKSASFSTYAYTAMVHEANRYIKQSWRRGVSQSGDNLPLFSDYNQQLFYDSDDFSCDHNSGIHNIQAKPTEDRHYDEWEFLISHVKSARSKLVLHMVYKEGLNFRETGERMNLTKERIRQLHDAGLNDIHIGIKSSEVEYEYT